MKNKKHIESLDGLRAIAVILVLLYHFQFSFAKGGFIGVDIFFVLSGYLITNILLNEWLKKRTIDYRSFWKKRVRRLLPAVLFLVVAVYLLTFFLFPASFKASRGDSLAGLLGLSNWWYIIKKLPYFASFTTVRPLKHLWSLAIEAQFYLFFPLILVSLLKWLKKRQKVLVIFLTVALISAGLMAILYSPLQVDRVYYGTDTRLYAPLLGSCLAFIWPYKKLSPRVSTTARLVMDSLASLSLIVILGFSLFCSEYNTFLYRGGFLLVAVITCILIAMLVHPASRVAHLFSSPPLLWLGERSYSIYLWHYPIIALFTPIKSIGTFQPLIILLQLALIFLMGELSYQFIEMPIRKNGLKGMIPSIKAADKKTWQKFAVMLVAIAITFASLQIANAAYIKKSNQKIQETQSSIERAEQQRKQAERKKREKNQALIIGDSVLVGVEPKLKELFPKLVVDGVEGRQMISARTIVQEKYQSFNTKKSVVIIELGTNSPFPKQELKDLLNEFNQASIFLVNCRAPRNWEAEVNQTLAEVAKEQKNVSLIDWYSKAIQSPALLVEDGVHLSQDGVNVYSQMIVDVLNQFEWIDK